MMEFVCIYEKCILIEKQNLVWGYCLIRLVVDCVDRYAVPLWSV